MKAKEMFEELGYERKYEYIPYVNCEDIEYKKDNHIIRFCMTELGNDLQIISKDYQVDLGIKELKAINKQVEELGWKVD